MPNKIVKLLFYCTVAKPYLYREYNSLSNPEFYKYFVIKRTPFMDFNNVLNGKIVAEAECDLVEEIKFINDTSYGTNTLNQNDLLKESCIGMFDLYEYLFNKDTGYGIYLKNVKPFDEPKELSYYGIKKAPQNMCYLYDKDGKIIAVVISVKSPYMRHIMNDDKTIEVRKSILNIFKELMENANSV